MCAYSYESIVSKWSYLPNTCIFFPITRDSFPLLRLQVMNLPDVVLVIGLYYFLPRYDCIGILFFLFFLFMISLRIAKCHEFRALLSGWWITRPFKASDPFQPDYTAAVNGDTFRHSSLGHARTQMASVLSVAAAFLWREDTELVPRHLTLTQRVDYPAKGYCYVFTTSKDLHEGLSYQERNGKA